MTQSMFQQIKEFDQSRENIPGEHWLTLIGAVGLWLGTRRHPSLAVRVLGSIGGTLLIARALTGRDVPPTLARWMPYGREANHR